MKISFLCVMISNILYLLSLLKPLLVLSYCSNFKSHLKIFEQAVIKQYCVYKLVLLRHMAYFRFVTAPFSGKLVKHYRLSV
jgi:hypothetical protein